MLEVIGVLWAAFTVLALVRICVVGRIQWRALDLTWSMVDAGILDGSIDSVEDIILLYEGLEEPHFFAKLADLTRWTLRDFHPELARWEAEYK